MRNSSHSHTHFFTCIKINAFLNIPAYIMFEVVKLLSVNRIYQDKNMNPNQSL